MRKLKPPKPASMRSLTIVFTPSAMGGVTLKFKDSLQSRKSGRKHRESDETLDDFSTVSGALEGIGLRVASFCDQVRADEDAAPLFPDPKPPTPIRGADGKPRAPKPKPRKHKTKR